MGKRKARYRWKEGGMMKKQLFLKKIQMLHLYDQNG